MRALTRRRLLIGAGAAALPPALLLVHLARVVFVPFPLVETTPSGGVRDGHLVRGALHVHTTASDGRGDLDEVARAASEAELDFIVLADHNVDPPPAHRLHGVLMVPGVELSTSAGHLFAAGATRTAEWRVRQRDPFEAAAYGGGMAILAHPVNQKIPWTGSFEEAHGIEVVSGDSLFREAVASPARRLLPALSSFPASRMIALLSINHRHDEAFELWEEHPHLVGVCAHDSHGYEGYLAPFAVMQMMLEIEEPLPEDPEDASRIVVETLMRGEGWCALGGVADAGGFAFGLDAGSGDIVGKLDYERWPRSARPRVALYRDGALVADGALEARVEAAPPGRYRAEVYLEVPWTWGRREFLWIFTSYMAVGER